MAKLKTTGILVGKPYTPKHEVLVVPQPIEPERLGFYEYRYRKGEGGTKTKEQEHPAIIDLIREALRATGSVTGACRSLEISTSTYYAIIRRHHHLRKSFARARKAGIPSAEAKAYRDMKAGHIDPLRWLAARDPARWNPNRRIQLDIQTSNPFTNFSEEQLRAIMAGKKTHAN